MSIQWKKVTWYSTLFAIILFVATFYIGFNLGKQTSELPVPGKDSVPTEKNAPAATTTPPISITSENIKETYFIGTEPKIVGASVLAKDAQAYINKTVSDFRTQANTEVPPMIKEFGAGSPPASYEIDLGATLVKSTTTESIVIVVYTYTGGANGSSFYKVFTASNTSGKIFPLSSEIKSDQQNAFTAFVQTALNNWRPDGSTDTVVFPDSVKALTFDSFTNWSLDDKNLTIYFDQYSIGPGSLGETAFPLPLDQIKDFLN